MSPDLSVQIAEILSPARTRLRQVEPAPVGDSDFLMQALGVTPADKAVNAQLVGRTLGTVWERLVRAAVKSAPTGTYGGRVLRPGTRTELCDLQLDTSDVEFCVDAKYRLGSGDSKTLRSIRQAGQQLREAGKEPLLLVLREDSNPVALAACSTWTILTGEDSLAWVREHCGCDLRELITSCRSGTDQPC